MPLCTYPNYKIIVFLFSHARHLYYTDHGSNPKAVRTNLDGSQPEVLQAGLTTPNGIVAGPFGVMFLESNYNAREHSPKDIEAVGELGRGLDGKWNMINVSLQVNLKANTIESL